MEAQNFWHTVQEEQEKVGDFICRLEILFKFAYGHEGMSVTKNTLLYEQLEEGLRHKIMESPAIFGTTESVFGSQGQGETSAVTKKRR